MGILSSIAAANTASDKYTDDVQTREQNTRTLARMREQDATANRNRAEEAGVTKVRQEGFEDQDPSVPAPGVAVDVASPAVRPANLPGQGRVGSPAAGPQAQVLTPDQSTAESARLANKAPPVAAVQPGAWELANMRLQEAKRTGAVPDNRDVMLVMSGQSQANKRLQTGPISVDPNVDTAAAQQARFQQLRSANTTMSMEPDRAANARMGSGTDFATRIMQAESNGNPNAVGKFIPGQGTAKGSMQVMDATNKNPGLGVRPAQDNSPEERARVGRDYAQALLSRYGNEAEAAAAYNWGLGNYDKWKAAGADPAKLPAETRAYVAKVTGGAGSSPQTATASVPAAQVAPAMAELAPVISQFYKLAPAINQETAALKLRALQLQQESKYLRGQELVAAQTEYRQINSQLYEGGIYTATAQAGQGDAQAMNQLAQAAQARIGRTADGKFAAVDENGKPTSAALSAGEMAYLLYQRASPAARARAAQVQQAAEESRAKKAGDVDVEREKGVRLYSVEQLKSETTIRSALIQAGTDMQKVHTVTVDPLGQKPTLVTYNDGSVREVRAAGVVNGVQIPSQLLLIKPAG